LFDLKESYKLLRDIGHLIVTTLLLESPLNGRYFPQPVLTLFADAEMEAVPAEEDNMVEVGLPMGVVVHQGVEEDKRLC